MILFNQIMAFKAKAQRKRRVRARPLTRPQVKAVARIAKKVDIRTAESKRYQDMFAIVPAGGIAGGSAGYGYGNLVASIAQGTTAWQRVGEKIHLKNIYVKGFAKHVGVNNPTVHFYLIRTRFATPTLNAAAGSGIFEGSNGTLQYPPFMGIINRRAVQVLGHRSISFDRSALSSSVQVKPFTISAKVDKDVKFMTGTSNMTEDSAWKYMYLYFVDEPGNTGTATGVTLDVGTVVTFSDA